MGGSIIINDHNLMLAKPLKQIFVLMNPPIARSRDHEDPVLINGEDRIDGDEEMDEAIIESMEEVSA